MHKIELSCLAVAIAATLSWGGVRAEEPFNPESEPLTELFDPEAQPYNPEAQPYNPEADPPLVVPPVVSPVVPPVPPSVTPPAEPPKPAEPLPEIVCDGQTVCREPDTGLPLRVLARAFSKAYQDRQPEAAVARESIPSLTPLYVFAREGIDLSDPAAPLGWYQVGETEAGPPFGWLTAADAVEWRQALVVAYTHPGTGEEGRQRVLMFEHLDDLQMLTESDEREIQATAIYQLLAEGRSPAAIVSREPQKFVNITHSFYLLPIVDYRLTDIDGDETRYLRLAAAVPEARGASTLEDPAFRKQAEEEPELDKGKQQALNLDIVFVMDMTRSMQPYIDNTRKAIKELADSLIEKEGLQDRVRFGLVGYRDSVSEIPAMEFTARNFTPALVTAEDFNAVVAEEAAATVIGSVDYPEEVYAGVEEAMYSTAWRDNALHLLVLVGDASAHEPDHKQSTTGKDAPTLKLALNDKRLYLLAMHLQDYRMGNDHPIAEAQFSVLSKIPGSESSAYVPVQIGEQPAYETFKKAVGASSSRMLSVYRKQGVTEQPEPGDGTSTEDEAKKAAQALVQAALVDYLGQDAESPKDILVWALDRDLTNPSMRSMEVRVLVTKNQLSNLILALDRVMQAMQQQKKEQIKLFEALQSVASATMKNPDQIGEAQELVDTGLLPKFIQSLPYKSEILSLTEDRFASLTADQRASLERSLSSKLQQYRVVNEQVDGWVKLNPGDPDANKVYPLHLSYLP
jgi:serine/threonine-protein kinase PpkA